MIWHYGKIVGDGQAAEDTEMSYVFARMDDAQIYHPEEVPALPNANPKVQMIESRRTI